MVWSDLGDSRDSVVEGAKASNLKMRRKLGTVNGKLTRYDLDLAYKKRITAFQRTMSAWSLITVIALVTIIVVTSMIDSSIASNFEKIAGLVGTLLLGVLSIPLAFVGVKTTLDLSNAKQIGGSVRRKASVEEDEEPEDEPEEDSADDEEEVEQPKKKAPKIEPKEPADIRDSLKEDADKPSVTPPKPGDV